jgi:hypothetical protein
MTGYASAYVLAFPDVNRPEGVPSSREPAALQWEAIVWRPHERYVQRMRQKIFAAAQAEDLPLVRNLQKLSAPRGALAYPRLSREEFEGRFLGLMPYLELKGEGNNSMAGN